MKNTKYVCFLVVLIFSWMMQSAGALNHKKCLRTKHGKAAERKFSVSTFLHGLANTCNQLGNAVAAENEKEKQQAAFGVAGSLFSLAGHITAKEDATTDKAKQDSAAQCDKKTIELIDLLVEEIRLSDDFCLKDMRTPLLLSIASLESREQRQSAIIEHVRSKETAKIFFKEVFSVLQSFIIKHIPDVIELLQKYVLKTFQEVRIFHRTQADADEKCISDQAASIVNAFYDFMLDLLNQDNIIVYVKDHLISLVDYVHEKLIDSGIERGQLFFSLNN